jgi:hypothetical protein
VKKGERVMAVKGVQFVTDSEGHKVAVQLDLKEWGELWEDIYDNMIADERAGNATTPLEDCEATSWEST